MRQPSGKWCVCMTKNVADGINNLPAGLLSDEEHRAAIAEAKTILGDAEFDRLSTMYRGACQLSFKCQNCGNCCKVCDPIILAPEDIKKIAHGLKLPIQKVIKKYVKLSSDGKTYLKHVKPCKFYDPVNQKCKIYSFRPTVCEKYPFLAGQDDFTICTDCPGSLATYETFKKYAGDDAVQRLPPVAKACRDICQKDPEIADAVQTLIGVFMCVKLNEIGHEEAAHLLMQYHNQKKLNIAATILTALFKEEI